jgi:flagellar motor switch protein FliM
MDRDDRFAELLQEEVLDAEVDLSSLLLEKKLSLGEFLHLRPGDVIPVQLPEMALVYAEDVPVFRGRYGQSNGRNAVRFHAQTGRRERNAITDQSREKNPA